MTDLSRLIGGLQQRRVQLQLDTADLCFLLALRFRADVSVLPSFEEELLYEVYEQFCELTDPGAPNPRKRATHAIQRLREQRLLARVDGNGLVRAGEYTVTRLAQGIVDFFTEDETLTHESLTVLTKTLLAQLSEIVAHGRQVKTPEGWSNRVILPLRVTVSELVSGIERRQRSLDVQQESVREQIGMLLTRDWFGAVDASEQLLEATTRTLSELNEVLLQDMTHLQSYLQEIDHLATDRQNEDAAAAARQVSDHVDRVTAWGSARLRAWSDYYQYVQRYLRSVVRLDPDRAVSQRLRDQTAGWTKQPFYFFVADAGPIHVFRDTNGRIERPPVTRPSADHERELEDQSLETLPAAEELVEEALRSGCKTLAEIMKHALPRLAQDRRYLAAGELAAIVMRLAPARIVEREWVEVQSDLECEDWPLGSRR